MSKRKNETWPEYWERNKEKEKIKVKKWKDKNREDIRISNKEYMKKYTLENKESILAYRTSLLGRFKAWKFSALKRQKKQPYIVWELEFEDIKDWPLICYYTGRELTLEANCFNTISLDRKNSLKGYTLDNIVFCCVDVNRGKSDLTIPKFKQMIVDLYNNLDNF